MDAKSIISEENNIVVKDVSRQETCLSAKKLWSQKLHVVYIIT